jgi:hypothetical protein
MLALPVPREKQRVVSSVTVYDVAREAGVSITTVSRVLNAPDKVSPDTRERVRQAIDRLGFVPKAEAAARARKAQAASASWPFLHLSFVRAAARAGASWTHPPPGRSFTTWTLRSGDAYLSNRTSPAGSTA